jgi:hypothetical protein
MGREHSCGKNRWSDGVMQSRNEYHRRQDEPKVIAISATKSFRFYHLGFWVGIAGV